MLKTNLLASLLFLPALFFHTPLQAGQSGYAEAMNALFEIQLAYYDGESSTSDTLNALYKCLAVPPGILSEEQALHRMAVLTELAHVHLHQGHLKAAGDRLKEARLMAQGSPVLTDAFNSIYGGDHIGETARRLQNPLEMAELAEVPPAGRLNALAQESAIHEDKNTGSRIVTAVVSGNIAEIVNTEDARTVVLEMPEDGRCLLELGDVSRLDPELGPGMRILAQCAYTDSPEEPLVLTGCTLFLPPVK